MKTCDAQNQNYQKLRQSWFSSARKMFQSNLCFYLKSLEAKVEEKQVEELRRKGFPDFIGETVDLGLVARERNVPLQILKRALFGTDLKGYRMIGDYLLSESKIESVRKTIEEKLSSSAEASSIIESLGIAASPTEFLSFLDYEIEWNRLDYETSKVRKKKQRQVDV